MDVPNLVGAVVAYNRTYYLKKAFALYPGVIEPVAAAPFMPHYLDRRRRRGPWRALLDAAVGTCFHLWIPWRAFHVQRRFGLDSNWRRRAIHIARAGFADPNDIALFRIDNLDQLRTYIRRFEYAALNKRINPAGWSRDCALVDKALFADRCATAGLPHPDLIALVRGREISLRADPAGRTLVVKPVNGEGGDGVKIVGKFSDGPDLLARLPAKIHAPGSSALLIQALVDVHPELADLALPALPTARIITVLDESGIPEVIAAAFRCASRSGVEVDNVKAGGLIAPIDLGSGRLGTACYGHGPGEHDRHPVNGAPIQGRTLPDWCSAKALAMRAHRAFLDFAMVGWDVAFAPGGPLLIEGNGKPGLLMPQRAARRGLATGRCGELLAHHLATRS